MFRKKPERYVVELSLGQARIFREGLIFFRNKCLREGILTEDIDVILLKLLKS